MATQLLGSKGNVEKTGIVSISAKWTVPTEAEALAFLLAKAPHNGVPFSEGSYTQTEDGEFDIDASYEGFPPEGGPNNEELAEFSFDGDMAEERIESHPKFEELKEDFVWDPEEKMFTGFLTETTSEDGLSATSVDDPRISQAITMKGVDKWLVVGGEYSVTYSSRVIPSSLFRGVGTKVTRPRGIGQFNLDLGERSFLKLMPRVTKRGNAVQIQERFRMSGPKGISEKIYAAGQLDPGAPDE